MCLLETHHFCWDLLGPPRSFEGRDDEPPDLDQGGGGTDVATPFSASVAGRSGPIDSFKIWLVV